MIKRLTTIYHLAEFRDFITESLEDIAHKGNLNVPRVLDSLIKNASNPNYWIGLKVKEGKCVAFSVAVLGFNLYNEKVGTLWLTRVCKGNNAEEGFREIEHWFRSNGVKKVIGQNSSFGADCKARERMFKMYGFKLDSHIYIKELD